MGVGRRLVVRRRRGEQRNGGDQSPLTTRRRAGGGTPLAASEALDRELMPPPIVQRGRQRLGPPGSRVVCVLCGDALLEEGTHRGAVVEGPRVDCLPELVPDLAEPVRRIPGLLPDQ